MVNIDRENMIFSTFATISSNVLTLARVGRLLVRSMYPLDVLFARVPSLYHVVRLSCIFLLFLIRFAFLLKDASPRHVCGIIVQ